MYKLPIVKIHTLTRTVFFLFLTAAFFCTATFSVRAEQTSFEAAELDHQFKLLEALGIVKASDLSEDTPRTITRAELAVLAARALKIDALSADGVSSLYSDVDASHPAAGQINYATQAGIFSGTAPGIFSPDETVSLHEAIAVCVKMLKFDRMIDTSLGYPMGYITMATSKKLLDNVNAVSDGSRPALRADVYTLIYNAIHTDLPIFDSYGATGNSYYTKKDVNILSEYWQIYKSSGVVTADNQISIKADKTQRPGSIMIEDKQYLSDTVATQDKVGKAVEFYYKKQQAIDVIIYIEDINNKVLTLSAESIENFDYENGRYETFDNNRTVVINVGKNYRLAYNGDSIEGSDRYLMDPRSGSITFIDNNSDNIYDVIMVWEYYNLIVDRYDSYNNIIYDKFGGYTSSDQRFTRNVELNDYSDVVSNIDLSNLTKETIVTVYKSPGMGSVRLTASKMSVTGTVESIVSGGAYPTITVSSKEYRLSEDLRFDWSILKVGGEYTFYLDSFLRIAHVLSGSEQNNGYIMRFSDSQNTLEKRKVQILDSGGSLKVYDLSSKINITTMSETLRCTDKNVDQQVSERLFVLFDTNKDKEIINFTLPHTINTEYEYNNLPAYPLFKMNYFINEWPDVSTTANKQYRYEIKGFNNWLIFDEQATVYEVPTAAQTDFNDETVNVLGISAFSDKTDIIVNKDIAAPRGDKEIEVYKMGNDSILPNVLVNYKTNLLKSIREDSPPTIITGITTVYDTQEDTPAIKLTLNDNGTEKSLLLSNNSLLTADFLKSQQFGGLPTLHNNKKTLDVLDIIKYEVDKEGKISNLFLLYDASNDMLSYASKSLYDGIFRLIDCKIKRVEGNFVEVILKNGITERTNISGAKVIVCKKTNSGVTVTNGTVSDISPDDLVLMYSRYVVNRTVVVYKSTGTDRK